MKHSEKQDMNVFTEDQWNTLWNCISKNVTVLIRFNLREYFPSIFISVKIFISTSALLYREKKGPHNFIVRHWISRVWCNSRVIAPIKRFTPTMNVRHFDDGALRRAEGPLAMTYRRNEWNIRETSAREFIFHKFKILHQLRERSLIRSSLKTFYILLDKSTLRIS